MPENLTGKFVTFLSTFYSKFMLYYLSNFLVITLFLNNFISHDIFESVFNYYLTFDWKCSYQRFTLISLNETLLRCERKQCFFSLRTGKSNIFVCCSRASNWWVTNVHSVCRIQFSTRLDIVALKSDFNFQNTQFSKEL